MAVKWREEVIEDRVDDWTSTLQSVQTDMTGHTAMTAVALCVACTICTAVAKAY